MRIPRPTTRTLDRAAVLGCIAVAFLAFLPTLRNGFVATWDDGAYVLMNQGIRELSLSTVLWAFTTYHATFWTPLTWITLSLDYAVWELDPVGYHLTNTALHAANAGLVFLVARELVLAARPGCSPRSVRAGALLAALAWALHPLRVESVAWITERKDVLSAALGLAAVLAWLRYTRTSTAKPWRSSAYLAATALFGLAVCAKAAIAPLPVALLALDIYPLRRLEREPVRRLLLEKVPWLLAGAVGTVLTMRAHAGAYMPLSEAGYGSRMLIALRAVFDYLRTAAWPLGLSPFYLHPGEVSALDPAYLAPAVAVVAACATALWQARRRPAIAVAWFTYLAMLAPGLAATQVSVTARADRFTYFPDIALAVLLGGGMAVLLEARPRRATLAVATAGAALILAGALGVTLRLIPAWRDDVALWTRAIEVRPHHSGRVYSQRATAHQTRGNWVAALADMDEAVALAAAKRHTRMQDLYAKRGRIKVQLGDLAGASEDLGLAVEAAPPMARARLHGERAEILQALGRLEEAEAERRTAAALAP